MGLVQSKSGTITAGTSLTITLTSATTAGNCLIVYTGEFQGTTNPAVSGITLGGSADHFAAAKTAINNAGINAEIWIDRNCAAGQTSVVITFTAGSGTNQGNAAWVEEWSGIVAIAPVDKTNSANGSGTAPSSGSTGTLTQASELIVGCIASSASITGPGVPWANQAQLTAGAVLHLIAGHEVVAATTAQAYSGTTAAAVFGAVIVSLLLGPTPISDSDSGSGADSGSVTVTLSSAEAGSGTDAGVIDQPGTETGSGADSGTLAASVPGADTAAGLDAAAVSVSDPDTGAATEAGSVTLGAADTDTGSGADAGSVTSAAAAAGDTGTAAEGSSITATLPAAADTASGADTATVSVSDSDAGSAAEAASQALFIPPPTVLWRAPDYLSKTGGTMK